MNSFLVTMTAAPFQNKAPAGPATLTCLLLVEVVVEHLQGELPRHGGDGPFLERQQALQGQLQERPVYNEDHGVHDLGLHWGREEAGGRRGQPCGKSHC